MPERFIYGYKIPDQYGITLADVIEAIRQERLQPYHPDTEKRLPAPSVKKRCRRFSADEIMAACMKENGKRRKQGLGPLAPGTQEYKAFLDKCWHTEDSYSWKHLKDSQADKVKPWHFLVEELEESFGARRRIWQKCNYEADQLRERLSKTDEELISERLEDRIALPKGVGELEQRTRLEELLPQRRSEWKQKLAVLEAEIRALEADLVIEGDKKHKTKRPNVTARWDVLADVKRKKSNMTAKQLREHKAVVVAFEGNPPTEDRIRKRLKKDYDLTFS